MLPTREEYIKQLSAERNKRRDEIPPKWSDPMYICPKCGGNVRKDLWITMEITTIPPIHQSIYTCDSCGFTEYIED